MKPLNRAKLVPLLLFLALMLPVYLLAIAGAADAPLEEHATLSSSASTEEQQPKPLPPEVPDDTPSVQQQYPQDPTGVRARLGMCRKGQGGHGGGGHHHRFRRGDAQWDSQ
jgi:hypothetical protein